MVDLAELLKDLDEESEDLDRIVAGLPDQDWQQPTPAPGWTIAHQIAHLAWTDAVAVLAATDPQGFAGILAEAVETGAVDTGAAGDVNGFVDRKAAEGIAPPAELLTRWRQGRTALSETLRTTPADRKLPWFGPPMSPAMTATGRLMETWAHGQDVADALGITRAPTSRLRHVAYIGFRTLGHGFAAHGRPVPDEPVRLELAGPDGQVWRFGPVDAPNRLTGPALDFCLLVTQRRHRADLALNATGSVVDEWLDVAQAFAGPPGDGREPTK